MMTRIRFVTCAVAILFAAGCAQQQETAPTPMAQMCPVSGESVDDSSPSVQFEGQTVRFCCDKCLAKWNAMSDADKHDKLAAMK